MAKKRPTIKISPSVTKGIIILIVLAGLLYGSYRAANSWLVNSNYFKVKAVVIDPSLQFISLRDVDFLKGESIFEIDLKKVQRKISQKYPQVSDLKVFRRFPDEILLNAKKRYPFAQISFWGKLLTLDEDGVLLSAANKREASLSLISGLKNSDKNVRPGFPVGGRDLRVAFIILDEFNKARPNANFRVEEMDASNLSNIVLTLTNKLKVIAEEDDIKGKMRVLGFLLSQRELDFEKIKYIDLRFKEPIIGKK
ncbi:MAG: cell division protein FtsQ/DivIB [Candidatus Omnitrophica bacterium]|nr:cell division protein FtsQ/DivIB [Candidatus Omnitrophota bacterium]